MSVRRARASWATCGRRLQGKSCQVGSGCRGAARRCVFRRGVEFGGDRFVRSIGGEREVPGARLGVDCVLGELPMRDAPLVWRDRLVDRSGEQWMLEADAAGGIDLDQAGSLGRLECFGRCDGRGRRGERRRQQECVAGLARQAPDAQSSEILRAGGNRKLGRGVVRASHQLARDLERVEGVAFGSLDDLHDGRAW